MSRIEDNIKREVQAAVLENNASIQRIKNGSVRILTSYLRIYSRENLRALFEKQEFKVESTFVIFGKGHLLPAQHQFEQGQQVGIIVTHQ